MALTKKITKTPAVRVETRKLPANDMCECAAPCRCMLKHLLVPVLLVINTLLLVRVLYNQVSLEVEKVGGRDNYKMVQEIYRSQTFKQQQAQQIQQALQLYQGNGQQAVQPAAQQPTAGTPVDTTTPVVTQ